MATANTAVRESDTASPRLPAADFRRKTARGTAGDGSNWYSYCANDPVNYVDVLGLCSESTKDAKDLATTAAALISVPDPATTALGAAMMGVAATMYIDQRLDGALSDSFADAVENAVDALGNALFSESDDEGEEQEVDSSTPTGRRGQPLEVEPGTNEPTKIEGRQYTGHAIDRMQGRGIPPSAVENAIQNGTSAPGNSPNTTTHTSDDVVVVTNETGGVITVYSR